MFVKDRAMLRNRADAITREHCCDDFCVLEKLGFARGRQFVYECLCERDGMTRAENKDDLRGIVKVCCVLCYVMCCAWLCVIMYFFNLIAFFCVFTRIVLSPLTS